MVHTCIKLFLPLFFVSLSVLQSCSRSNTSSTSVAEPEAAKSTDSAQVPEMVLIKFTSLFPAVTNAEWEKVENDYEVTFQENQGKKSVRFTPEGDVISSATAINTSSLPEAMNAYIAEHLKDKKIENAEMNITATGTITYEIEVEGKDFIFDGTGKFLKTEEEESDEKD